MEKPRILLVEDDDMFAGLVRAKLKSKYYISDNYALGEEALKAVEKEEFDLVLMDITLMGVLDGIETVNLMKQKKDIPFIYLTSFADSSDTEMVDRMKETEPFGYANKAGSFSEIEILIEFALYRHQAELERKKQEKLLREKEELLSNILKTAIDPIILLDCEGKISFWNDAAAQVFSYTSDEALGKTLDTLIVPHEFRHEFKNALEIFRNDGIGPFRNKIVELDARKKTGETFPSEISVSRVMQKDKWHACVFIRDNSSRKELEDEMNRIIEDLHISRDIVEQNAAELVSLNHKLSESETQLKELNASKDRFFSIIAHDLKGPFQGLLGYSELLSRDIDRLDKEEIADFAKNLHSSSAQLFKLLENLLQWSRIQRGVIEYNPSDFLLYEVAVMNVDLINPNASRKNITVENKIEPDISVFADINMLNTVIRNLLSNAVKFTHKDGKIVLDASKTSTGKIKVYVSDNGVGMEDGDLKNLFKIDRQHTTTGTSNETGTGLGLILCKELVEKNGGEISVMSTPGEGTTFSFILNASSGSIW